jgi:two-component system OmpR family sensor kinase
MLVLITVAWLVGSAVALRMLWSSTEGVLDAALDETAEHLLMLPDAVLDGHDTAEPMIRSGPHNPFVVYQVFDADGRLRLRSRQAPLQAMDQATTSGVRVVGEWRVATVVSEDGHRRAMVAERMTHRRSVLRDGLLALLAALAALLPLVWLGVGWSLRRGFALLEPARRSLEARQFSGHTASELAPVSSHSVPAELKPWVDTVNALLARVKTLVDQERTFAAGAAHELRTPLAAARAQAQRLLQTLEGAGGRAQGHAQALVRQLDRLTQIASRLLQIARVESGIPGALERVDLVPLAHLLADEFHEASRAGRLRIEVRRQPLPVAADIDSLGVALRNLIDNALKHGGEGATVTLRIDGQRLEVEDNGPGVPPQRLASLVRPFTRDAQGAVPGSGLGLAMADAVAHQCGARLVLQSPTLTEPAPHGFRACLDFDG